MLLTRQFNRKSFFYNLQSYFVAFKKYLRVHIYIHTHLVYVPILMRNNNNLKLEFVELDRNEFNLHNI